MNERIFHLSGNESLEVLKEFLEHCTADSILFLFPRKSWIFHQNTDLKKLRDFAEKKKKELTIVTNNALARITLQAVGIAVLATLEDREKTPFEKSRENFSSKKISTIPIETLRKALNKKTTPYISREKAPIFTLSRPVLHALLLLGILLMGFFFFLLKIAIPVAVVKIAPFKKEEEMHINVHMLSKSVFQESDLWRENNGIFTYPIEKVFVLSKTFSGVSKEFLGENAHGKMKITNTLPEEFTFRNNTRIQNQDGVVFLIQDWITIPPAKNGESSEIEIEVVASEKDKYEKIQGEKGNMPKGQHFFFPGLKEEYQEKIFAENITPLEGGKTEWIYKITKSDIEKAKEQLIKEAKESEKTELLYEIEQLYPERKDEMEMLPLTGKQFLSEIVEIKFEKPEEDLIGEERTEFSGEIRVRVQNYIYSKNDLISLIEEKFKRSAPEGMDLLLVNRRVLVPEVLSLENNNTLLKVSFSTRGIYQYIIEPKSKKGLEFSQKVKKEIVGVRKDEAEKNLINNFEEVSDVQIDLWPTWVKTLPTLSEKIQFEILEE